MNNQFPEMKPIPGCPGYFITQDGDIYSNKQGQLRMRSVTGKQIQLSVDGVYKSFTISTLVKKAWREASKAKKVKLIQPNNWRVQDVNGHFI